MSHLIYYISATLRLGLAEPQKPKVTSQILKSFLMWLIVGQVGEKGQKTHSSPGTLSGHQPPPTHVQPGHG